MIAMRYGCVPVVSAVGGLMDTVVDGMTGVVIGAPTAARLLSALKRTISAHGDAGLWTAIQRAAMAQDFSWSGSARKYFELYSSLVPHAGGTSTA
jgi:starch synthase